MIAITGFSTITDKNSPIWLRIVWSIFVLIISVVAVVQIWERTTLYFKQPITMAFELQKETSINFPAITLCPSEPYGKVNKHDKYKTVFDKKGTNLTIVWEKDGVDVYSAINSCEWNGIDCLNVSIWTKTMTILGRCYTLSINNITEMAKSFSNMLHPLEMQLNKTADDVHGHSKWNILLHHESEDVAYLVLTRGISLYDGHSNDLYFTKRKNRHIQPCDTIETANECQANCMDNGLLRNSSCKMPFMKTLNLPLCKTKKTISRVYQIPIHHYHLPHDIRCLCPSACNVTRYDVYFDTHQSRQQYQKDITYVAVSSLSKRLAFLYTYERCDYNFYSYVCDMGAIFGLFFGVSVLKLCEVVDQAIFSWIITRFVKHEK